MNLCTGFSANTCDLPEFLAFFLISLLIEKPIFEKTITDQNRNIISIKLQGLLTRNNTINFTKICQKSFLYRNWNTIICETSMKMTIFNSNGSFYNFYPNLPKIFIIHKNVIIHDLVFQLSFLTQEFQIPLTFSF